MFGNPRIRIIATSLMVVRIVICASITDCPRIVCIALIRGGIKIVWTCLIVINASFAVGVWIARGATAVTNVRIVKTAKGVLGVMTVRGAKIVSVVLGCGAKSFVFITKSFRRRITR